MPYETFDLHFEECEHALRMFRPAKESKSAVTFWHAPASMRAIARSRNPKVPMKTFPLHFEGCEHVLNIPLVSTPLSMINAEEGTYGLYAAVAARCLSSQRRLNNSARLSLNPLAIFSIFTSDTFLIPRWTRL